MASSVCDCCLAFWKRKEDSTISPLAITHRQAHGTGIQALVISVPLY